MNQLGHKRRRLIYILYFCPSIGIVIANTNILAGLLVSDSLCQIWFVGLSWVGSGNFQQIPAQCGDFFVVHPTSVAAFAGEFYFGRRAALFGSIPVSQFDNPVGKEETNGPQYQ